MKSQSKFSHLKPGDKVWVVYSHPGRQHAVVKVGRKWITIECGDDRFDIDTGIIDGRGYSSLGKVYLSEDEYKLEKRLEADWRNFVGRLCAYIPNPGVTLSDIQEAARLLRVEIE